MPIKQLLREWPPGYGGVERVAHELATIWGGTVYSLDVQCQADSVYDPLPVAYRRRRVPCFKPFGRLHLPLPSRILWLLLHSNAPLHGHLPSPGVLLLLLLARLICPRRQVTAHWHCFLEPMPGRIGYLSRVYQWLALWIVRYLSAVVTTSPQLAKELRRCGCSADRVIVLSCCLSENQEQEALIIPSPAVEKNMPVRVLFIGRLDSYKRLDWLLEALASLQAPWRLSVVGDGPNRARFEKFTQDLFDLPLNTAHPRVHFYGRLSEAEKLEQLAASDLLVLPSDSSNEAFGIVQLEAMAAGRPALAFDIPRSGMGWVCQLPGLTWSQSPEGLAAVLQQLADQPRLRSLLSIQARERYLKLFARSEWLKQVHRLGDQSKPSKV